MFACALHFERVAKWVFSRIGTLTPESQVALADVCCGRCANRDTVCCFHSPFRLPLRSSRFMSKTCGRACNEPTSLCS